MIAFDAIIDDDRSRNAFGLLMSLNMLIEMPGGFDYTGADCQEWRKDISVDFRGSLTYLSCRNGRDRSRNS